MADAECGRSLRHWGFLSYKKRDATYCPRCKFLVLPGARPGTWDFPEARVPIWSDRETILIDIEVKAGDTALAFSDLRENQREWAESTEERPKWIWLCLGKNAVNAKEHPRKTWLFPYEQFLLWEEQLDRKSLPYDHEVLKEWELEWAGNKIWTVPDGHPLRTEYHYL
jgi:hypothetical protein